MPPVRRCLGLVLLLALALAPPSSAFAPCSALAAAAGKRPAKGLRPAAPRPISSRAAAGVCMARRRPGDVAPGVDLYATLGVTKEADAAEIKQAYRKLAAKYHPDVNPNGSDRFVAINDAFEVLGDEALRRQYNFGRVSGLSDDFADRVSGFRQQAGPQYRDMADKAESLLSDSRRLVVLQLIPLVGLLVTVTVAPTFLHDLLLGPRDKKKK
mmetsp:Transcript_39547/g.93679  ORF Transcript_39547/g.93679 Transcript_39547/m.93679 type:complete len:212 (-) Transcript_39547:78-713(-)